MSERICPRCGGNGPFPPHFTWCYECKRAYQREWDRTHPEQVRVRRRKAYDKRVANGKNAAWEATQRAKETRSRYVASHRDAVNAYHCAYQRSHPRKKRVRVKKKTDENH